ncbi:MAG: o-succinylbenzoate synthase [Stigonema ocellatum SAG 48.90 = DSM 106950]|nr:o-succinylbenzoate synthase [Stigonema ocellatum SAG 48.90 = DSM 106950]
MVYRFEFRPYRQRFVRSLTTSHGIWNNRDGIILRLTNETGTGWGEIAPISWFGSETLEQALDFCRQLHCVITDDMISSIPDELPACQFGFESAAWGRGEWGVGSREWGRGEWGVGSREWGRGEWGVGSREWGRGEWGVGSREWGNEKEGEDIVIPLSASSLSTPHSPFPLFPHSPFPTPHSLTYSGLLPAGEAALEAWQVLWLSGYGTFKWKIGVYGTQEELEIFELLTQALPASAKLRLDANGGLSYEDAHLWLWACDRVNAKDDLPLEIEFIEQPLSVEQFQEMLELSSCYTTAIALDESVATLHQLAACYQQGWREIFVIKPGIVGSPSRLRQFCQHHEIDAVFSSVFETAIGRQAALQLAAELSQRNRAVGFGINHFFVQQEDTWLKNLWNDL